MYCYQNPEVGPTANPDPEQDLRSKSNLERPVHN